MSTNVLFYKDRFVAPLLAMTGLSTFYEFVIHEKLVKNPNMSLRAKQSNLDIGHKLQFSKDRFVAPLLAMTGFSTFYEFVIHEKLVKNPNMSLRAKRSNWDVD